MSEKLRVLAVDDNEEFCQNITDILGLRGYEVVSAYNGLKALELVRHDNFDLVLMDVKMPIIDGVEIFKKLKEIAPDVPVIMVSAYTVEDLIREALREGAFGFLKKPLDFEKLFGLIEYATGKGAMILVADDDKALCANLKDALSDKGYRVSIAYDGETAVQASWEDNFDIMLIDMKIPILNGLETYLVIRDIRPDVVAIMLTGYLQEVSDLVEQALQKSAYTCLEKPIDMENLLSLLEQIKEQKDKGTLKKPQ